MKTYNNLFEKICSYENFYIAYENATKGKRHYKEVIEIEKDKDNFLKSLADEVREMKYKVSQYVVFKLWSGGKYRDIYKLPMRDRIVQHAIMVYCERIFRESFIQDTFSSIKGRGIHRGLKRLKRAVKDKEYKYVLQLDIHHCYPSIDQQILKQKLRKKFKDERLILLFDTIIDSCDKGVPIGNYTSQYFNNFYFSGMDHWIKEQIHFKHYFRYCDDIVIFGKTKQELHLLFEKIKIFTNKLNVKIKSNYKIFPKELGINFLGYITREKYIRIRKTTKNNFIKKVKKMNIKRLTEKNINVLGSYWGIFKHADCRNLWHKYINNKIFNKNNYGK